MNMKCILWRARFIKLIEELDSAPSYKTLKLHLTAVMVKGVAADPYLTDFFVERFIDSSSSDIAYVCYFRRPLALPNTKYRIVVIHFNEIKQRPSIHLAIGVNKSSSAVVKGMLLRGEHDPHNTFTDDVSSDMMARATELFINN